MVMSKSVKLYHMYTGQGYKTGFKTVNFRNAMGAVCVIYV